VIVVVTSILPMIGSIVARGQSVKASLGAWGYLEFTVWYYDQLNVGVVLRDNTGMFICSYI